MITPEGLQENFRFLTIEVINQVGATYDFLVKPSPATYDKIISRDDYIDNLKSIIENKCFSRIHKDTSLDQMDINRIRAIHIICVNLERIADFCVNVVKQVGYLSSTEFLSHYNYQEMFSQIKRVLPEVERVLQDADLAGALAICRSEFELDRMYKETFDSLRTELAEGSNSGDLITVLFIFRYLERIGDSLLNIGEALIFSIIGERIKIQQFQALQRSLSETGFDGSLKDIDFTSIWGTRSGCRIGRVDNQAQGSIFKEGNPRKIRREKENIEKWAAVYPGLGPKVFSYHEESDMASMLVEFLPGCTLDELILTGEEEIVANAFFMLRQTIADIWEVTREPGPVRTNYVPQIRDRLDHVLRVHPALVRKRLNVGETTVDSTRELLAKAEALEKELPAPFAVFIHGDFNVNNLVYTHEEQRIHYVDFHRSEMADYIQDVSVFLISNFRMPIFQKDLRRRINNVIRLFYVFARNMAAQFRDATFEARMALALARSFYTSTRFELNIDFARLMFLRAHYLLDKLVAHEGGDWEAFRLPEATLYY